MSSRSKMRSIVTRATSTCVDSERVEWVEMRKFENRPSITPRGDRFEFARLIRHADVVESKYWIAAPAGPSRTKGQPRQARLHKVRSPEGLASHRGFSAITDSARTTVEQS